MNSLESYINNDIKPIKNTDSVADAQDLFVDFPYSHFPVTEEGVYIGCVGRDAVEFLKSEAIMAIKNSYDKNGINIPFPIRTVYMNKGE